MNDVTLARAAWWARFLFGLCLLPFWLYELFDEWACAYDREATNVDGQ